MFGCTATLSVGVLEGAVIYFTLALLEEEFGGASPATQAGGGERGGLLCYTAFVLVGGEGGMKYFDKYCTNNALQWYVVNCIVWSNSRPNGFLFAQC